LAKIDSVKNVLQLIFRDKNHSISYKRNRRSKYQLSKALYFDAYNDNKSNGAFILIDAATNTTAELFL
jgi:sulfate adenylyltransferase subunit 1